MTLDDPVAIYDAANNVEAQLVKMRLVESGVEAFALEDVSVVGLWYGGILPEIHKPQVFVNRCDLERARPILQEYKAEVANRERFARRPDEARAATIETAPLEVVCEDCGKASSFPASQRGSVQLCPHCGGHVDVGDVDDSDPYWLAHDDADEA